MIAFQAPGNQLAFMTGCSMPGSVTVIFFLPVSGKKKKNPNHLLLFGWMDSLKDHVICLLIAVTHFTAVVNRLKIESGHVVPRLTTQQLKNQYSRLPCGCKSRTTYRAGSQSFFWINQNINERNYPQPPKQKNLTHMLSNGQVKPHGKFFKGMKRVPKRIKLKQNMQLVSVHLLLQSACHTLMPPNSTSPPHGCAHSSSKFQGP